MLRHQDQLRFQRTAAQQGQAATLDIETQAESLLERANAEQAEQLNLLEVASHYATALAAQVESKHDQVERIEDRLENLIEQQASRLQQSRSQQPGMIALPSTKAKWQSQIRQQENALQRLQGRLEMVREIKDGMGAHGPRIEELATRKLRQIAPELSNAWDEEQAAVRRHQVQQRNKDYDRRDAASLAKPSQGMTLAVSAKA